MKPFFTYDDFDIDQRDASLIDIAHQANAKLEKLIEGAPVVYDGNPGNGIFSACETWGLLKFDEKDYTAISSNFVNTRRKARLMFIEEIEIKKELCEHEPERSPMTGLTRNKCKHCGVKLQATWSEKK